MAAVVVVGSCAVALRGGLPHGRPALLALLLVGAATAAAIAWMLGFRSLRQHRRSWATAGGVVLVAAAAAVHLEFVRSYAALAVGTTLAYGVFVRWSPVPRARVRHEPLAGLAIAPLLLSQLAWYRDGLTPTFAIWSLVTFAVLELYVRFGSQMAHVEGGIAAGARLLGQGIAVLASGAVMCLVVIPLNLGSRLFRYSPLDGGWAIESSAWLDVDSRRLRTPDGRPARPSSMGMLDLPPSPRVLRRRRARSAVALLLIAAALAGVVWNRFGTSTGSTVAAAPEPAGGTFGRAFEDDPAFEDAPWAEDLRVDLLDAWSNLEFNAAVGGWRIRDGSSEFINIRDGERQSTAPDPALGEPLEVWFFGGSAAFGAGQRDDHTIPSELVRQAEADGIALHVRNFGVPATVNWQSATLLLARLAWEAPPDLVVFYDGNNDLALQDLLAAQGRGEWDQPASLVDGSLDQLLRERSEGADLGLPAADPFVPETAPSPERMGAIVGTRYAKGMEVVRTACEAAGVPVEFFWQPELQLKQPLSDADRQVLEASNIGDDALEQRRRSSTSARSVLAPLGVVDLTSALDESSDPLYWDSVHTNEAGAELVAEAMFASLEPQLRRLVEAS